MNTDRLFLMKAQNKPMKTIIPSNWRPLRRAVCTLLLLLLGITALSALKKTRGHLGVDDHLVIIGAGGVGGSAVHIAPAAVAGKVIVADIDAQKRAQARQMGAVATIDNAAPDAVKQVM